MWVEPQPRWCGRCSAADGPFGGFTQRSSVGTQSGGGCREGGGVTVAPCLPSLSSARCGLAPSHAANFCTRLRKGGSRRGSGPAEPPPHPHPEGSDVSGLERQLPSAGWRETVGLRSARVRCCRGILLRPRMGRHTLFKPSLARVRLPAGDASRTAQEPQLRFYWNRRSNQQEAGPNGDSSEPLMWVKPLFPDQYWSHQQ